MAGEPADLKKTAVNEVVALDSAKFVPKSQLGTTTGPDGMVTDKKLEFNPGEPIRLSMWLAESPAGLQTSAIWYDENDKVVAEERKAMNGGKLVTFSHTKRLSPGRYRVVGYWGGNIAAEYVFKVEGPASSKKKKG